nr:MAG TPA: hypothetical protein [Caudoviricetes sp.]
MYLETDSPINLGNGNGGYGNGAWGNDWVLIILFALIFGWGNNGTWGNGGGSQGATDNYVLASDFASIQRQLSDGFGDLTSQTRFIQNGICDGFYAMNTSLLNGFGGVNTAIMQNGYETRNAINGVSQQLASCCCDVKQGIEGINYNLATQGCAIQNTIQNTTRDIIDNANANARALHDELVSQRLEAKNERISELQSQVASLQLKASQEAQNNYLIDQLRPTAKPAYVTCSPFQSVYGYGYFNNGCNGCGSVQ